MINHGLEIRDFEPPDYDPFLSDELNFGDVADPYPLIHRLHGDGPVHEGDFRSLFGLGSAVPPGRKSFVVVGTDEVTTVLTDQTRFSNQAYALNLGTSFGMGSISTLDNPEHGRFRKIFQRIFLPQNIRSWGETIVGPVIDELVSGFKERGTADLVQDFTIRFPFEIIFRQLGLPQEHIHTFQRLAIGQTDFFTPGRAKEAGEKLGRYFEQLVKIRRRAPGVDLVSLLATTEVDGEYLPPLVLISFLRQLMNAAGDTTYRGTSILLAQLLRNPRQLEAVRVDRRLVPDAIEEGLRFDGPVVSQTRQSLVDTRLGGVDIPAGAILDVVAGAANRDPQQWDHPDQFDIFGPRKAHWSFSRRPQICVGQQHGRVKMTWALEAVLDRLPGVQLDPGKPVPEALGVMMRVPRHLHVRFSASI